MQGLQVSVCSGYNFCHPDTHLDTHTPTHTDRQTAFDQLIWKA